MKKTLLTVRTKRTNRLVLDAEFEARRDAESAAIAILRSNPDRYSITLICLP